MNEEVMEAFGKAIWALVSRIQDIDNKTDISDNDKQERSKLSESILEIIKKAGDLHPSYKSRRADEIAGLLNVGDLCEKKWKDQPSFDKGRKIFIREHMHTVSDIRDKCINSQELSEIIGYLCQMKMVWILKAEDAVLTNKGYRTTRDNPEEAYKNSGITIVKGTAEPGTI